MSTNRELLPTNFFIKTKHCMDKNRAIVMMLHKFGIRVHDNTAMVRSLEDYNSCFSSNFNLQVNANYLGGTQAENYTRLKLSDLLKAYGRLT